MYWDVARYAMETVTVVCTVCGLSRLPKERYRLWEASGKATGLHQKLTCVVEEEWSERSQYHSSVVCSTCRSNIQLAVNQKE